MITVYASAMSRSRRVLWACEEAEAPYEIVELAWPPSAQPGYLAINPAGTVPAMRDGDLTLSESLAICEYVARRHKPELILEPGEAGYWRYLELCQFGEATLQPTLAWTRRFGPLAQAAVDHAREAFAIRVEAVGKALADGRAWLMGERFTLADISVGFPLIVAPGLELADLIPAEVMAYRKRLGGRPACQRAYAR
ncbi:glutathione S-transferase [Phenylobacterium sp.]|uniref:glutathione S-transferase family protein n=1 Tax=Phenylobacterium sp. TaxID=1871053 RepID=UPI002633F487|nr:glutathione S-transferase [Phenylobacterium sp.]